MENHGTRETTTAPATMPLGWRGLPDACFSTLPTTGELILLKRGVDGYFPCQTDKWRGMTGREEADERNGRLGVGMAQESAMLAGSMFGWDAPGADLRNYGKDGFFAERDAAPGSEPTAFTRLYEKAVSEQAAFRADLLAMKPREVLDRAYEYYAREEILNVLEDGENQLLPFEAQALLAEGDVLPALYEDWRNTDDTQARMEDLSDSVRTTARHAMRRIEKAKETAFERDEPAQMDGSGLGDALAR